MLGVWGRDFIDHGWLDGPAHGGLRLSHFCAVYLRERGKSRGSLAQKTAPFCVPQVRDVIEGVTEGDFTREGLKVRPYEGFVDPAIKGAGRVCDGLGLATRRAEGPVSEEEGSPLEAFKQALVGWYHSAIELAGRSFILR